MIKNEKLQMPRTSDKRYLQLFQPKQHRSSIYRWEPLQQSIRSGFNDNHRRKLTGWSNASLKTESKKNAKKGDVVTNPNEERIPEIATKWSSRIAESKIVYSQETFSIKNPLNWKMILHPAGEESHSLFTRPKVNTIGTEIKASEIPSPIA